VERRHAANAVHQLSCSVGRISISLTDIRHGRVTMYSTAEAMSSACRISMSPKRLAHLLLDQHPLPLLHGRVDGRAEEHHASVVDERVQPSELVDGALHQGIGLLPLTDVGFDRQRSATLVGDPAGSSSRRPLRRAAIATVAPFWARARALAAPIPLEAPVTSATVPVSSSPVFISPRSLPTDGPAKADLLRRRRQRARRQAGLRL
jgi:hypothetical protein